MSIRRSNKRDFCLLFISFLMFHGLGVNEVRAGLRARYPNIMYQEDNYTLEIELYNTLSPDADEDGYIDVTPSFQDIKNKGWKHWVYQEPGHTEITNQEIISAISFAAHVWSLCTVETVDLFTVPPYIQEDSTVSYTKEMTYHIADVRQRLLLSEDICDNTAITIEILAADTLGALYSTISMVTGLIPGSSEHQVANVLIKAYGAFFSTQDTLESYRELFTSYGILNGNENIPTAPILMKRLQSRGFAGSSVFWKAMTEKYIDVTGDGDQGLVNSHWDSTWAIVLNEFEGAVVTAAAYYSEAYYLYGLTAETSLGAGLSAAVDGIFSVSNLLHLLSVGVIRYGLTYMIDDGTYWRDKCAAVNYLVTDNNNGLVDLVHQSAINLTSYAPSNTSPNMNAEDALAVFYGYGTTLAFEKRLAYLEMEHALWIKKSLLASVLYLLTGGMDFSNDNPSSVFADEYHKLGDFIDVFYDFTTKPQVFIDAIYPETVMAGSIVNFKGHGFDLDGWISHTEWRLFTAPYTILAEDQEVSTIWEWGSGNVRVGMEVEDNEGNKNIAIQLLYINQASPSNAPKIFPSLPTVYVSPGSSDSSIDLDDYVQDPDHLRSQLRWSYSGNVNIQLSIDPATHILTISTPEGWRSLETITLTVKDPSDLGDSETLFIIVNDIVQLTEGTVTPSSGNINDEFTYSVVFKNTKGQSPTLYGVYTDDEPHSMIPGSVDLFAGRTYTYTTNLSSGSHNYYFVFSTSDGTYRYPESESETLSGPSIAALPTLLSEGKVTPMSGIETDRYDYSVTYTNPSGQAPKVVYVTIDGDDTIGMHKESGDFVNGALYKCSTAALSTGQHGYFFTAQLQDDSLVTTPSMDGPSISEAGQLQVSMVSRKPKEEYEVGERAWLDIEIKDEAGDYVDPDGAYPIQVGQTSPEIYYNPIRTGVGIYEVQTTPLRAGYTTVTCIVHKTGYTAVSASIQFVLGDVGELDPVEITNIQIDPPSINPGTTNTNISYSISKTSLVTIRILDGNNEVIRTLINHLQTDAGTHVELWDGEDDGSNVVSDGSYRVRVEAVCSEAIEPVSVFAPWGRGEGELYEPKGIWAYQNKVYVVDGYYLYDDTRKGSIFGTDTSHLGEFNENISWPKGIALDSSGNVFVVSSRWDNVDPTIYVYDNDGVYQGDFGGGTMTFSDNPCIAVGSQDDIYVGSHHSVYKFSQSGNLLDSFSVSGLNQDVHIVGVAVDEIGNIWASFIDESLNNSIIKKFAQDGSELQTFSAPIGGMGLSVRRDGLIFSKGRLQIGVYDTDGAFLHSVSCGEGNMLERGIFADNEGYIYTACITNFSLAILREFSTRTTQERMISADSSLPTAIITTPSDAEVIDGHISTNLNIRGTASDPQFSHYFLEWSDDGNPGSWNLICRGDSPVEDSLLGTWAMANITSGDYFVRLSVYDGTGTTNEARVAISYVDDTSPSAVIIRPKNITVRNIVIVEALTNEEDVEYIDFEYREESGEVWGLIGRDYTHSYAVNWDTRTLDSGDYELRACAVDTAGNRDDSPEIVQVSIDDTAPSARISSPLNGSSVSGNIAITAESQDADIESVLFQYRESGQTLWTNIGAADTSAPWSAPWNTEHLVHSVVYELRAVATDSVGNSDDEPEIVAVTVDSSGSGTTLHDWNGDGIVSIVGDVPSFVQCVYFQNCPSDVDTIAVGDCNGDAILSIVGDVPCFVDCVYFDNCEE